MKEMCVSFFFLSSLSFLSSFFSLSSLPLHVSLSLSHAAPPRNAKYRYVQLVRSLKTYGITFFDCREKNRNHKKPVPVFIGVTRDKIMKVDPETMRPIKEWTLEQLRRWSAAHNTFTLDFGDYEDDYVNVVTEEGEAMSQLIAGYIDIILKTRVDTDRVVADDDDDVAEEEMMTGQFGIANVGMTMSYSNPYGQGAGQQAMNDPGAQYSRQYPGPSPSNAAPSPASQRVNVVDMGSAVKVPSRCSYFGREE